jgi:hypothetical protein
MRIILNGFVFPVSFVITKLGPRSLPLYALNVYRGARAAVRAPRSGARGA